jgi:predicted homoserine dehydrogenase-like protein
MIIVDRVLAQRQAAGKPVRVAMFGSGYMGRCIALQFVTATHGKGIELVAIVNRTVDKAEQAYRTAGLEPVRISTAAELDRAIEQGRVAVSDDPAVVMGSGQVDAIIEATGHVEYGTQVVYEALRAGKHVIMLGAEVDASVGPILKTYADRAGVVLSYTDGDEPGVGMNLVRFVDSMGYEPVLVGQMKGFLDRYRNPQTQTELAIKLGQNPAVLACFADGSKLALEAAITGNATGLVPQVRGMKGYPCAHINDMLAQFTMDDFSTEGFVDFSLGAAPHTGAFVICRNDHPEKRKLMTYLKMGNGPLYMFHTPYHLPPWQIQHSVARAVLFDDPTITPRGAPVCDTISYAKRDLKAGEQLDGMGGFTCYGLVDRANVCATEGFLPIAVSLDCVLVRDVPKDQPIRYSDVRLPPNRLVDRLRAEQATHFKMTA